MKQSVSEDDYRNHLMEKLVYELPVLRARLGISQAELAKRVGISRQTYNNIEIGKKRINWLTFNALVAVFKSNEGTNAMLEKIDGFENELLAIMDPNAFETCAESNSSIALSITEYDRP